MKILPGFSSDFLRNFTTLMTGTGLAQVVPLAMTPLLTRIYTPEDFGLLALFTSILFPLAAMATGRYDLAILLPSDDRKSTSIVRLCIYISALFSLLLLIPCLFYSESISLFFGSILLEKWIRLIPLGVFLMAAYSSFNYWLLRIKAFKQSALNKVAMSTGYALSSTGYGFAGVAGGLVLGDLSGRIAGSVMSYFQAVRNGLKLGQVTKREVKIVSKEYIHFPVYNGIPSFLDSLSLNVPVAIIHASFNSVTTGFFNLSRQVIAAPLLLISSTMSQVLFQKISEKKNANLPVLSDIIKLLRVQSLLALGFLLIVVPFSPVLFSIVFGEEWRIAGEFTQILALGFAIKFVVSPLSLIFPALNAIKTGSFWQLIYFLSICTLFFLGHLSIVQFLVAYTLIEVLVYLFYLWLIVKTAKNHDSQMVNNAGI
jgi:O-antigen/teichoic acid export membrane protein